MRNLVYCFFYCAILGCNKQGNDNCKLVSTESDKGFFGLQKTIYEYDQQGRLIKIIDPTGITNAIYYADSIVVTGPASITTYYITSAGLATHSKSKASFPDVSQATYEYTYTYDTERYLIQYGGIHSRLDNGITIRDTVNWKFTIQNGNITEFWSRNVLSATYRYTNLVAKESIAFTNQPIYPWRFLGKFSRNLLSSKPSITGVIRFEYELDNKNNIVKRKESDSGFGGYNIITTFNYQCD